MNSVHPYISKNSNLHYFGEHSIILVENERYLLDDIETYLLEKIDGEKSIDEIVEEVTSELEIEDIDEVKRNIIEFVESKPEFIHTKSTPKATKLKISGSKSLKAPNSIIVSLTNKCHQKCIHCFKSCDDKNNESIPTERLLKALEFLKGKLHSIQLTGGEPMLHKDFNRILGFCKENFVTKITTTGTLINLENVENFKGISSIQIPIYAINEKDHDAFTGTKGSHKKVMEAIDAMIKHDIYPSVSSILTRENVIEAEQLINLCIRLKVPSIRFGILFPLGRAHKINKETLISESEMIASIASLKEKYKDKIYVDCDKEEDYNIISENNENIDSHTKLKCLPCWGGVFSFAIGSNGKVRPCEIMPENIFSMGNIINDDIEDIINKAKFDELPTCISRWQKDLNKNYNDLSSVCIQLKNYHMKYGYS